MKAPTNKETESRRALHLVKATEPAAASQQEMDSLIANGVRRYQELQQEVDHELFAEHRDLEKLAVLLPELQLIRQRLASYGVNVHP